MPSKVWEELIEAIDEHMRSIFKGVEGVILVFGPAPNKDSRGAKIRVRLKEEINNHIKQKSHSIDVIAKFPEDINIQNLTLDAEAFMVRNSKVKLVFCVWSKDAPTLIAEITHFIKESLLAMKLRIFIDKKLWESKSFLKKEILSTLKKTFSNVYVFDFDNEKPIIDYVVEIVDGHLKWASERGGIWPYDTFDNPQNKSKKVD